jgi:hypothetical protein
MLTCICREYIVREKNYNIPSVTYNIDNDYFLFSCHLICFLLLLCCPTFKMNVTTIQYDGLFTTVKIMLSDRKRERDRERKKSGTTLRRWKINRKRQVRFFSSFFPCLRIQLNVQPFTIASHYKYPPFSRSLLPSAPLSRWFKVYTHHTYVAHTSTKWCDFSIS